MSALEDILHKKEPTPLELAVILMEADYFSEKIQAAEELKNLHIIIAKQRQLIQELYDMGKDAFTGDEGRSLLERVNTYLKAHRR